MKVEFCTGLKSCAAQRVEKNLQRLLGKCNYQGLLQGDPDSRLSLVNCQTGTTDISIVSDKANLSSTFFRIHSDGRLEKPGKTLAEDETVKVRVFSLSVIIFIVSLISRSRPGPRTMDTKRRRIICITRNLERKGLRFL